jgi:hypothetical protein
MHIHQARPFNTRFVIWSPATGAKDDTRSTHRTAKCSYWYIMRQHGIDEVGPTPNYAERQDLVDFGRIGPRRANDPALDGIRLWQAMDEAARSYRPNEATLAHCVGSLPIHEDPKTWRDMVEGFVEDHLASQGMVADWAVHAQEEGEGRRRILPHVHLLVTTRVYDRSLPEFGRRRQNWLRTPGACRSLAEKWYAHSGIYPPSGPVLLVEAA